MARKSQELIRLTGEIDSIDNELKAIELGKAAEGEKKATSTKKPKSDEATKKVVYTLDVSSDDSSAYAKGPVTRKKTVPETGNNDSSSSDNASWCASGSPCTQSHNSADSMKHKCPACHMAVNAICRAIDKDACLLFKTTCWPCYDVTGRSLKGEDDVFFGSLFINK
jgi:hypothetical protein